MRRGDPGSKFFLIRSGEGEALSPDRAQFGVYRGFHHAAAREEVDQIGGERASVERW